MMDPKWHTLYLKHTQKEHTWWSPIFRVARPTVFYYMDRLRYGKYFETKGSNVEGYPLPQADFTRKHFIQLEYQRTMEEQGAILRELFIAREATEDSKVVDYLIWIAWQWDLYEATMRKADVEHMEFLQFVQSDLSYAEELTEPDCYGKNRKSSTN
jgi:hypothetical protein